MSENINEIFALLDEVTEEIRAQSGDRLAKAEGDMPEALEEDKGPEAAADEAPAPAPEAAPEAAPADAPPEMPVDAQQPEAPEAEADASPEELQAAYAELSPEQLDAHFQALMAIKGQMGGDAAPAPAPEAAPVPEMGKADEMAKEESKSDLEVEESKSDKLSKAEEEVKKLYGHIDTLTKAVRKLAEQPIRKAVTNLDFVPPAIEAKPELTYKDIETKLDRLVKSERLSQADRRTVFGFFAGNADEAKIAKILETYKNF